MTQLEAAFKEVWSLAKQCGITKDELMALLLALQELINDTKRT